MVRSAAFGSRYLKASSSRLGRARSIHKRPPTPPPPPTQAADPGYPPLPGYCPSVTLTVALDPSRLVIPTSTV